MLSSFLMYYINRVILLNNFHACIGRMGGITICILIIYKRGWQCKAGIERFTPHQSEDPAVSNCFALYLMLTTNSIKHLINLSISTELYERKIFD